MRKTRSFSPIYEKSFGEIFATKVTLDTLSPRVYKMTITWRDTSWGINQIIAVRKGHPST